MSLLTYHTEYRNMGTQSIGRRTCRTNSFSLPLKILIPHGHNLHISVAYWSAHLAVCGQQNAIDNPLDATVTVY